jgi:dTDP-4-amino-4,6-dideoxy-D-galactose acyltransferase
MTMQGQACEGPGALLEHLPWDSRHFGFAVARVAAPALDDPALRAVLDDARRNGVRLVYWAAAAGRVVPEALLHEFGGLLADRKATFQADLSTAPRADGSPQPGGFRVTEYAEAAVSGRLLRLAVAAGEHSRFRTDPRIPRDKFEGLYESWIRQSVARQLADAVLVAEGEEPGPAGLVTVAAAGASASIGLIAVEGGARGRGLGALLMHAAHRWMAARGAVRASVVTQLENRAACRLYERCGYVLDGVRNYYHFWPLHG